MAETAKSPPQVSPGLVSSQMVKVYVVALVLVILAELIGFVRWTPIENPGSTVIGKRYRE